MAPSDDSEDVRNTSRGKSTRASASRQTNDDSRPTQTKSSSQSQPNANNDDALEYKSNERSGKSIVCDTGDSIEDISDDDLCPICQLLLCKPVTTTCNHTLCESCMATWADVSVLTQMEIVDVDEEAVPFNVVSGLEARCPMCRSHTSASFNEARSQELQHKYPKTFATRQAEEEETGATRQGGEIQTLTLSIGNRHRPIEASNGSPNTHEWTFFVRPSRTNIIEEVHIHLHPTFRRSKVICQRPPYQVTRIGWGYFTIIAYVMLKPGYSWVSEDAEDSPDGAEKGMLGLEWTLDFARFNGRGSMGRLKLKVRNQRDWKDMSDQEEEDERMWSRFVRQYQRDGVYQPPEEEL